MMKVAGLQVLCVSIVFLCSALTLHAQSCKNGGHTVLGNHPKCSCTSGFKGYDCSQRVSPCEGRPCRNGAKCLEPRGGTFICKCTGNFDGLLCEKRVRPCDSNPCENGGKCTDDGVKCFKCECTAGFKGSDCGQKILPCEVSPCRNGGICTNDKIDGFKCACKNGFSGTFCDRKAALYLSYILDGKNDYIKQLQEWLGGEEDWKLCYRASRDGWRSSNFHTRCDSKGPTVTIVRVGYYIFGGYADVSWGGSTGYRKSTKAFLFSLRNKDNLAPFKAPVYKNHGNAIYNNNGYGATFGGGHDLYVKDNAHTSTGSYSNFGHTYKPPTGYTYGQANTKALLAGNYNFLATEVETFYID